jgi:pyruvate kinase
MRSTRIVCTIGPKTLEGSNLLHLYHEGMSVARLNGSHGTIDWHKNAISKIHGLLPNLPILLDIPGRKIRTAQLKYEPIFDAGEVLILTTESGHDGSKKVPVNYEHLHADLTIGNTIMADDGTLRFTVVEIVGNDIYCRAETSGQLKSSKGINVPFVQLNTPLVTARDKKMIAFACENKVDFIGLSFVESANHIMAFRNLIKSGSPRIVAKVENQGGLDRIQEIIEAADAIMIDRGDLSVETSLYDLAIKQKFIIEAARKFGRPVIVATEMLHTMIQNPFPTKSEVCDISNAILDGCSATMLSGETAVGSFFLEAVSTMRQVIDATEYHFQKKLEGEHGIKQFGIPEAMSSVIPLLCRSTPITKIIAITRSGYAARMIATYRLKQPILAVSDDKTAAKSFNLISGTTGVFSNKKFPKTNVNHFIQILEMLLKKGLIDDDDLVLVTGVSYPIPGSRMNAVQIHNIRELAKAMSWEKKS